VQRVAKQKSRVATKKAKPKAKPVKAAKAARAPRPTAPSAPTQILALPPPPPAPPPERDEMIAPRDIARLLRYGERFGPHKIDVRMLPIQLPIGSGALAVFDPAVPKSWRVFDRPASSGTFRVMLSIARTDDKERLAAVVVHVGRPPIAKWTVAHYQGGKKPKSADALPRIPVTSGWLALTDATDSPGVVAVPAAAQTQTLRGPADQSGKTINIPLTDGRHVLALPCGNGEFAAYWAVDAADKPIAIVIDFDVFTQKEWKAKPPT
jgi:uncharacterized protein DUF4241